MDQETDLKLGCLLLVGETASPLPLKLTRVTGQIAGAVASVTVTQQFHNPYQTSIELEYLFPLPHQGAVVDYQITIGERVITADLKEVEDARQTYREAVDRGLRASLLEQRRPNLFSIQIGNVQPAETIITEIHYDDRLRYRDGEYEFVFPMGLTPRYHTRSMRLADARRTDAPVTLDDSEVAPVEISLLLLPGLPIDAPSSGTHPIQVALQPDQAYQITLTQRTIPNKDFVLRYTVAADLVRTALLSSRDGDFETAVITLLPPRFETSITPAAREFVFVIDRSGSMQGKPIVQAKNALRACIRALNGTDTFAIQAFDDSLEWFTARPLTVTQDHVNRADRWLDQIDGRGGTEILPAIDAALTLPPDAERQRYVVFLTDGAVSAEESALRKINKQLGQARVFSFGIGPSVNRYLLAKLAQMGRGVAEFLRLDEDIEAAITRFQDRVCYPVLQDITLEWTGAKSWDSYPQVLPDLYVGEPLEIVTRVKRSSKRTALTFSGTLHGQTVEMSMNLPPATGSHPALRRVWARARIESLLDQEPSTSEKAREQVISLALEHRLVTPFTSFVAVDSEVTSTTDMQRVKVAVPLPEGLDYEGFFGADSGAMMFMGVAFSPRSGPPRALFGMMPRAVDTDVSDGMSASDEPALPALLRSRKSSRSRPAAAHFAVPAPTEPSASEPQTVDDRLKWLARTQRVDGSWESAEMTAAALIAFVRAGQTTREGNYRRQVDKAARWLSGQLADLLGFDLLVAVRALGELHQASGDYALPDDVRAKLPEPRSAIERAACGVMPDQVPDRVRSLDTLRVVALVQGGVETIALKGGAHDPLVQAWLAVGKAPQP